MANNSKLRMLKDEGKLRNRCYWYEVNQDSLLLGRYKAQSKVDPVSSKRCESQIGQDFITFHEYFFNLSNNKAAHK